MKITFILIFLLVSMAVFAQPNWPVVTYTNSTTAYGIVTINSNPASSGDWVGAFVGNECRAKMQVIIDNGKAYANLQILGEAVETITFKVWDASENKELGVSYTVQSNPGNIIGYPPNYLLINAESKSLNVSPTNQNVPANPAGTTNFTITSSASWTATSNQNWCTVTPSGSGNGTIIATYSVNTTASQRMIDITVTVSGLTPIVVTVTQASPLCSLSVTPSNQNAPYSPAGTTNFSVTTNCPWSALSNQPWCTITPSGPGSGTITANYSVNTTSSARSANITVTVSGLTPIVVTVTQDPQCIAPVSPTSATASQTTITSGQSTTLQVNGGNLNSAPNWVWYTGSCGGTQAGTGATLSVSPTTTTTYYVQASACGSSTTCRSVTITVNPSYTISTSSSPTAGGTTNGSGTYQSGQSLMVTAFANNGYTFSNWTENGTQVSTSTSYTFTVSGNRTLVANFTQNQLNYTISASSSPTAGGTTNGSGTYQSGQSCTVTAIANSGYTFSYWTENGNAVSTNVSYTFTLSGNRTLIANFTTITCTAPLAPATCTTSIGYPANGLEHFTNLSCDIVSGADGYFFEYSLDGTTWKIDWGPYPGNEWRINHHEQPNVSLYYRVRAYKCDPMKYSNYTYASPQPIYTACDDPSIPAISGATTNSLNITLNAETPVENPSYTKCSIYSITTNQYVQANGTLGSYEVFQTRSTWGTKTVTGLSVNKQYCFYAKAKNNDGDIRFNASNFGCGKTLSNDASQTVKDIEGNEYTTITIGTQVWMGQNLKTTKYNDGTPIPLITDGNAWGALSTPAYCWYNNDISYKNSFGALYNWYAVNTGKLCPSGWHVPTGTEWITLTNFLGGENVAGGKLKETGTTNWQSPNTGATNESGFNALPGGFRSASGGYDEMGTYGNWRSSSLSNNEILSPYLYYEDIGGVYWDNFIDKRIGFSVRCLRDYPVSSEIISVNNSIKVYPNPTSDVITIVGLPANQKSNLAVYSSDGKLIIKKSTSNIVGNLDLSTQVPGIYLLDINNQSIKIIKK